MSRAPSKAEPSPGPNRAKHRVKMSRAEPRTNPDRVMSPEPRPEPSPSPSVSRSRRSRIGVGSLLESELEVRLKNQRVACHDTKPLTPDLKVLGQPVTSEVRSMTQKWQKCDFATITSYLSKLEPRFKDQNVSYGLRNTMRCLSVPYEPFLGVKIKKKYFW